MRRFNLISILMAMFLIGGLAGCSSPSKSPDVADSIRASLEQGGFKDVTVSQDRDKGVVTLDGHVDTETDKANAESLAKSLAGGQVLANQIAVVPPADKSDAKAINSDLDDGIEKNLHAALIQSDLEKAVKYDVKSGVVTLSGEVNSTSVRTQAEKIAASVPNVQQVVNEVQIKNQKATTSK